MDKLYKANYTQLQRLIFEGVRSQLLLLLFMTDHIIKKYCKFASFQMLCQLLSSSPFLLSLDLASVTCMSPEAVEGAVHLPLLPYSQGQSRKRSKQRTAVLTITHQHNENQDKKEERVM